MPNHTAVPAALTDPAFTIPPVPAGGPAGGIAWLRRSVARFCDGPAHQRRRRLATDLLDTLDPASLRRSAEERTRAAGPGPLDVMATVARPVPIGLLAAGLGALSVRIDSVAVAARSYQPGADDDEQADRAVADLVRAFGGVADEASAARIALLLQACEATAGLVGNATLALLHAPDRPIETVMAETLRHDPPVRFTRRLSPDGSPVVLDLAASGLPFGAGVHECPGRAQAVAIATGIVESLRGFRLVEPDVEWLPSSALRIPASLVLTGL